MAPLPLLSVDPRTAALFPESGCKDMDSQPVLEAMGSATTVTALARGRLGKKPVAIISTDGRIIVVLIGFLNTIGNATRGVGNAQLDAPIGSVRLTVEPQPLTNSLGGLAGPDARGVIFLQESNHSPLRIHDAPVSAIKRLRLAMSANTSPPKPSSPRSDRALEPSNTPQTLTQSSGLTNAGRPDRDWQEAELIAVQHLKQIGFDDARLTPPGADAGIDVVSTGIVAQVKHWNQPVGQPALRDLFGVASASNSKPVFYSLSGYTPKALEWASATDIALFTYATTGQVSAQNAAARNLAQRDTVARDDRLGLFARARADRYQREQEALRRKIRSLTKQMAKQTQSRRASTRRAAGEASKLLTDASRALDAGDFLPPADRRREDTYKVVGTALNQVKRML